MIARDEDLHAAKTKTMTHLRHRRPQRGHRRRSRRDVQLTIFIPCLKPPYGEIAVVDLTTQQVVWRRGFGPLNIGMPYSAGSFVTAGGLIFNAGVIDKKLRAIDVANGALLWSASLEQASGATPMSYVSAASGKQYILVLVPALGGHQRSEESHEADEKGAVEKYAGGKVIAYSLQD